MKKNLIFALIIFTYGCNKKADVNPDYSDLFAGNYTEKKIIQLDNGGFSSEDIVAIVGRESLNKVSLYLSNTYKNIDKNGNNIGSGTGKNQLKNIIVKSKTELVINEDVFLENQKVNLKGNGLLSGNTLTLIINSKSYTLKRN